jgi:hypothetical protein
MLVLAAVITAAVTATTATTTTLPPATISLLLFLPSPAFGLIAIWSHPQQAPLAAQHHKFHRTCAVHWSDTAAADAGAVDASGHHHQEFPSSSSSVPSGGSGRLVAPALTLKRPIRAHLRKQALAGLDALAAPSAAALDKDIVLLLPERKVLAPAAL